MASLANRLATAAAADVAQSADAAMPRNNTSGFLFRQLNDIFVNNSDKKYRSQHLEDEDVTIADSAFPMFVLPIAAAVKVTSREGDLPCHEDLQKEGSE